MKLLEGKTALITGATRGIGKAIALKFAQEGANIAFTGRGANEEMKTALEATRQEIEALGVKCCAYAVDASDFALAEETAKNVKEDFGTIDILVNNAGIYVANNFLKSDSSAWKRTVDVNLFGTMYPTHAVLPNMIERGYGRIINIGSVAGVYGIDYFVDYSATKGAIIAFTKALSKVVANKGITVNCISPGSINVHGGNDAMSEFSFIGRDGTPEELANAVMFAASDEASYMTGQNILIDGGRKKM
jgi:3-oxoacyl-[acyl-carrier protein] reductase